MKQRGIYKKVYSVMFVIGMLMFWSNVCSAAWTSTTIFTDGSDLVHYSGVSAMSDSRIVVSLNHDGALGRALRIFDVNASSASMVGGSLITGTSNDLYDVAYIGFNGTEEMFYVNRDSSADIFEYWWNPTTYAGTYKGIVSKYSSGSNFPGMDRQFNGTADDLVQCSTVNVYEVDGSTDPATWTYIGYTLPPGNGTFTGITAIGDINSDGVDDYITSRNNSDGYGRLNLLLSDSGSWTLGSGIARDDRNYTGVANLGDPDGDGYVELIVVGSRIDTGKGTFEYIETDVVHIPEPTTIVLIVLGIFGVIRKK